MAEITDLLARWHDGEDGAMDALLLLVYDELRAVARARMGAEPGYHTLEPTALIHEVFFRLVDQKRTRIRNRAQFFALSARIMRRILIDHARAKRAGKRGGHVARHLALDEVGDLKRDRGVDPVVLDDALVFLAGLDPDLCLLVELKHFGGFEMVEISEILGVPPATAYRHWKLAKAHLYRYFREASVGCS